MGRFLLDCVQEKKKNVKKSAMIPYLPLCKSIKIKINDFLMVSEKQVRRNKKKLMEEMIKENRKRVLKQLFHRIRQRQALRRLAVHFTSLANAVDDL